MMDKTFTNSSFRSCQCMYEQVLFAAIYCMRYLIKGHNNNSHNNQLKELYFEH